MTCLAGESAGRKAVIRQYMYDGPHIIAEYLNGSLIRKYIYGPGMDNPVAMVRRLSGKASLIFTAIKNILTVIDKLCSK